MTLYCGKVELGTGVETALSQIVAEELDVGFRRMTIVQGDTGRTPDQGYTVGSKTIQVGGPPIRQAAAEARQTLLSLASSHLGEPAEQLVVRDGVVSVKGDSTKQVSYERLIGGQRFERAVTKNAPLKAPGRYSIVGKPVRRVDIPAKVTCRTCVCVGCCTAASSGPPPSVPCSGASTRRPSPECPAS